MLLNVRRSILIQAPPERVWQEFETFDRVAAWFGRGHQLHQFELELGSRVDLSIAMGEERRHYGGPIVVLDREREVTFESNWDAPNEWPVPTFFTLRLSPLYDGTMVEIIHHGFERLGALAKHPCFHLDPRLLQRRLELREGGFEVSLRFRVVAAT